MTSLTGIRKILFEDNPTPVKDVSFLFPIHPYNRLKFKKRSGYKKRLINKTDHRGFDTETNYKGDIMLLCDDTGRHIWKPDLREILQFLTYKDYRKTINWFYNLSFDIESVLKMLPEDKLIEILKTNETVYEGFKLFYLPQKAFKVSDKSKHSLYYWDIAQFYGTSLDNASKQYLGDNKSVSDIKSLMTYLWSDKVKDVVYKYCIHDCDLTRRLAERMHKGVLDCNISFSKPFSRASLAETAFLENCDIPQYLDAPRDVNKYFYWSYYGGWFELFKRGYHNSHIIEYDINSAYPYAMLNLPDLRGMDWKDTVKRHKDAVVGVYLVSVTPQTKKYITPAQIRTESLSVHPQSSLLKYVTHIELETLQQDYKVKILTGYEGFIDHPTYPFRDYVLKLYEDKKNYKGMDDMMYDCIKRVLNGFYGKNIQRVGGRIGNCFNPIYASLITSSCRRQIWDAVKDNMDNVIGIQTDSIITSEEIDLNIGDKLGEWSKSEYKEGIFLLSGIYELNGDVKKTKIRGYETKLALKELLMKNPLKDAVEVVKEKPLHLKQCLIRKDVTVSQTNQFMNDVKTISCKYDQKRVWGDDCENWKDFCSNTYDSTPLTKEYKPVFESEYLARDLQVMRRERSEGNDGDGGILIRT